MREAPPSPAPGPARDRLAQQAADQARHAQDTMTAAADRVTDRIGGVVLARLRGPTARKHTRHWHIEHKAGHPAPPAHPGAEVKALDPDYIVPNSLVAESVEALRPDVEQVVGAAVDATTERVVGSSDPGGMFDVDAGLLADLIDEALEDLLGAADRYATDLRAAILDRDTSGDDLDVIADNVQEASRRGGNWMRLNARTVGTALNSKAVLAQARALGVTHSQWISLRDARVRGSHTVADGQVRPLGQPFRVGRHWLDYPGDPSGLPATYEVVAGCRCGLLLAAPDDAFFAALVEIGEAARTDDDSAAEELLAAAAASARGNIGGDGAALPTRAGVLGDPVAAPVDVVGWRVLDGPLDVTPGQQIVLEPGTQLGLAAPSVLDAAVLAVLVPRGTMVAVVDGAAVLVTEATVQVLANGGEGVQSRVVE